MAGIDDIREERLKKLALLRKEAMDPYPSSSNRTHDNASFLSHFASFSENESVTLAGRIMSLRGQGGILFIDLFDGTEKVQCVVKKDLIDDAHFTLFEQAVDTGDFVECSGTAFVTKRGMQSLRATSWRMLSKSLRPIPDSWYGLKDEDERYRKRYLDLLLDPELRELFEKKAKFWEAMRTFLKKEGFLEVETPSLELTTGGAEATPFATHHNDYDLDMYLRISVGELWQKRLMAAGFPRTFEIGRVYRNEGTSPNHLQEFTNMEFYMAYADYRDGMRLAQKLGRTIAQEVFGTTVFTAHGHTFDLSDEWHEVDYIEEIRQQTGVDVSTASEDEMQTKLKELGVEYEGENRERLTDSLWKHCRKNIAGPSFLVNHPVLISPLAKERGEVPGTVERFQILLAGTEAGNGYSELNNPLDQAERFEEQAKLLEGGDTEAMMPDHEFVEMLEYGMPPTCGFSYGERFFSLLAGKPMRETTLFPLMRPRS